MTDINTFDPVLPQTDDGQTYSGDEVIVHTVPATEEIAN